MRLALLAVAVFALDDLQYYSAVRSSDCACTSGCCQVVKGRTDDALAWGAYADEVSEDGWGKLYVHAAEGSGSESGFAMGFLEGWLTSERISQHFLSWYDHQLGPGTPESAPPAAAVAKFVQDQAAWARAQVANATAGDPYWTAADEVLRQADGILAGQNAAAPASARKLSELDALIMQAAGDLYDIVPAVDPSSQPRWDAPAPAREFVARWHKSVSCSAIVRVAPNSSDIFAGHTTWTSYQNMLRVYKHYEFGSGRRMSFSSKPGLVYSKDDFHTLPMRDQQLVVIETTNGVLNDDLYKQVTSKALLTWQRVAMANRLATNGSEWTELHARHNSGTYNNQYFVLDLKKFTPGAALPATDLLWISEQIPGMVRRQDVTSVLASRGFWPAYNVPYDSEIYNVSGYQAAFDRYGDSFSYTNCARARIFARDAPGVASIEDTERLLRYNKWQTDPLANHSVSGAISMRADLDPKAPKASGGIDSKITSFKLMTGAGGPVRGIAMAQCGPTHDDQPVFDWAQFPKAVRLGQPDRFNFSWVPVAFDDATPASKSN